MDGTQMLRFRGMNQIIIAIVDTETTKYISYTIIMQDDYRTVPNTGNLE